MWLTPLHPLLDLAQDGGSQVLWGFSHYLHLVLCFSWQSTGHGTRDDCSFFWCRPTVLCICQHLKWLGTLCWLKLKTSFRIIDWQIQRRCIDSKWTVEGAMLSVCDFQWLWPDENSYQRRRAMRGTKSGRGFCCQDIVDDWLLVSGLETDKGQKIPLSHINKK